MTIRTQHFLLSSSILLLVSACGGGGGSSETSQTQQITTTELTPADNLDTSPAFGDNLGLTADTPTDENTSTAPDGAESTVTGTGGLSNDDDATSNTNSDTDNAGTEANANLGSNNADTDSNPETDITDTTSGGNNNDDVDSASAVLLSPLPQPPLTPAPDQGDEPIYVSGPVSTVTEFFLVRDAGGKLPEDTSGQLSDADFDAGPLEPVIVNPNNLDPTVNRPPYFESLDNATVYAGETLNVLLKPIDPDGNLPGMYAESLPERMQYLDNFDGTKTLRWSPLQPDAGIHSLTVTAVDPDEPQYRSRHTIRIRVLIPDDQSNIVNLPPAVNAVALHTVQVNDPVVIHIRGTDPNGTIPTLELVDRPAGATFIPHHSEEDVSVLRFVPSNTGLVSITVVARDALNTDSTEQTTINIDVRPASDFIREGPSLRDLATPRDFRLGYASVKDFYYRPDGALYARTAGQEYNSVTPENSFKWSFINPLPGRYRWAAADNLVNFARVKGMEIHGHTLVWHRQLPNWIKFSHVNDRETHMREFIDRMLTRYASKVPVWDVVNEVFEEDGSYRNSTWFEAMGKDFVEIAFRQAQASAPNARLLYNDYDVAWNGPKSSAMFDMLQDLKDRQTPLDGVGFQMHIFADFDLFEEVQANFQKAADMDLNVYITELDVSIDEGQTEEQQAQVYSRVLDICLEQPRCKGLQTWGFTDMYSWRRDYTPLLLDKAYQPKPAYRAMQQRLGEN